jgi:predicted SAM-dependent methyltransferase
MIRKKYILGSGKPPVPKDPEAVYIDCVAWEGVDMVFDLELPDWPIESGSGLHINATHVAEHILNFATFMDECHRVLAPGGSFYLEVPFAGDTDLAFSDPTHKRFFTDHTFINYLTVEGLHKFGYFKHAWSILYLNNDGHVIRVHLAPVPDEYLTDDVLLSLHNVQPKQ